MANGAVAREAVFALRREIARIEGRPAERLDVPPASPSLSLPLVPTGAGRLDAALGGGLPCAALTEIHGRQTRDAGTAAGFCLALASLALRRAGPAGLLWIATGEAFHEAGVPYAPGILHRFGIAPQALIVAPVRRLEDALWVAEEAAGLAALSAVLLEVRGASPKLDLVATRRLHHRARATSCPLLLLRQAGAPEPTAAPVRLVVAPAPAGKRRTLSGPLSGSIGEPAFSVTLSRSRLAAPATFTLEWNRDERAFFERYGIGSRTQDHGAVVSAPARRTTLEDEAGAVVALRRSA